MKESFETQLVEDFTFDIELSKTKLSRFLARIGLPSDLSSEQALTELKCGKFVNKKFVVNNAGILFFGVRPTFFIKQSIVTCIRYRGNDKIQVIDRKDFDLDLVSVIDEVEAFVKKHTNAASKIQGFKRIDIDEYPIEAIREAIINAVCHRNYFLKTTNVFVNIYDDRIEVISPGAIPRGLRLKQIKRKSIPRNKLIYSLFKKIGYIEKSGNGLEKIEKLMLEHGLQKPVYETSKVFFQITFQGPKEKILELVKERNETDLRELGLNKRQIKALNYLQKNKVVSSSEYQKLLGTTEKTSQRDLKELIEKSFIEKRGQSRSTYYLLK